MGLVGRPVEGFLGLVLRFPLLLAAIRMRVGDRARRARAPLSRTTGSFYAHPSPTTGSRSRESCASQASPLVPGLGLASPPCLPLPRCPPVPARTSAARFLL